MGYTAKVMLCEKVQCEKSVSNGFRFVTDNEGDWRILCCRVRVCDGWSNVIRLTNIYILVSRITLLHPSHTLTRQHSILQSPSLSVTNRNPFDTDFSHCTFSHNITFAVYPTLTNYSNSNEFQYSTNLSFFASKTPPNRWKTRIF